MGTTTKGTRLQTNTALLAAAAGAALLSACGGGEDALPAAMQDTTAAADHPTLVAIPQRQALRTLDAAGLMNWAETAYPQYFPSHEADRSAPPYSYRYYP